MTEAIRDPSKICFVIPCKGRLAHLRESLPPAAAQAPCIVVDYDCPENSGDWVNAHHPEVAVVRIRNEPGFNLARARNLGAAETRADWIVFLDADVVPSPHFAEAVSALLRDGLFLRPAPAGTDTWGTLICLRAEFVRAGGYDEVFTGWGGEDDDLYARMVRMGLKQASYPATLLRSIPHDDELRVRYYETKDRVMSLRVNAGYMALKQDLQALSGMAPAIELRRALHAEVKRVLAQSLPVGAEARIELELPDRRMLPGWGVRRTLTYVVPLIPRPRFAAPAKPPGLRPPMPFIVGTGRCGTTLLRLMLDSHPDLAIPPETHFIPRLARCALAGESLAQLIGMLRSDPRWPQFGVAADLLGARLDAPLSPTKLLRAFYALYAERHGKVRCGDKTPDYLDHMALIRSLLPEARFVHLVRDGRDVALSLRGLWWGPQNVAEAATWWTCKILAARACGLGADAYSEVRYEDLVTDPEATLKRICAFIDLSWDDRMLQYSERAAGRLAAMDDDIAPDGTRIPAERIRALHADTLPGPDPSRIGAWREQLAADEVRVFELLAHPLLAELGYETVT